jgi:membrane protein required for colicin V production
VNIADVLIVFVLLVSVVQAAISGFFQEAFAIAGAVFGYIVAAWQYQRLTGYLSPYISSRWLAEIVAFLLIFTVVMILAGLLGRTIRWLLKEVGLSGIDRFMGALLGLVRGALLVAIVLLGMTAFAPNSRWLQGSSLAPYFQVVGRAAIWVAPSELRSQFYQGLDYLRRGQAAKPRQRIK